MKNKKIIGFIFLFMLFLSVLFISACHDQGDDDTSLKKKEKPEADTSSAVSTPTETGH